MKSNQNSTNLHLVIRASPIAQAFGRRVRLLDEHNAMICQKGQVAFAKFGACLGKKSAERLVRQIDSGMDTNLIIAFKSGSNFAGYAASIRAIRLQRDPGDWKFFVPDYYDEMYLLPSIWLLLDQELKNIELENFRLLSNCRPLLDVMAESRASMILVTKQKIACHM